MNNPNEKKSLQLKTGRYMRFIDLITESDGFKTLCKEFNIDENSDLTLTPEEKESADVALYRLFLAFGG